MKMPQIPDHWSWETLSKLGASGKPAVKAGPFGSSLKKEFYVASGFRVYGQEQVIANNLSLGNYYIDEKKFNDLQSCEVEAGDILVSLVGTFGKSLVVPDVFEPGIINPRLVRVSLDSNLIDPHFFSLFFKSPLAQFQLDLCSHGGTMNIVNAKNISELLVPVPPIKEQKRIAEVLARAEELRSKRREAIAQLDTLIQAIFLEMFGDPVTNPKGFTIRKIKDLLESASYGTSEKSSSEGEFPVLRMNNITRTGEIDLTDLKYMDLADSQKERYLVRHGDVLFNRTNSAELVGKTAIIRNISNPMAFAGYLVRLRVNKENDPEYLSAFLNTDYSKRVLRGMCKSIIGMANINATEVQTIKIPQPPLHFQQEFARRVKAIEKLKVAHRASLSELDALFASLQHRAFRGEL